MSEDFTCKTCGGGMAGDGYTMQYHCETVDPIDHPIEFLPTGEIRDVPQVDPSPDAAPLTPEQLLRLERVLYAKFREWCGRRFARQRRVR